MAWLWYSLLVVIQICGLGLNLFTLPGIWLMVGAAGAYGWLTGWNHIGLWTMVTLLSIAVVAEIVETAAGGAGAKKAGGSTRAAWGAIIGGLIGAIFLSIPVPILGTIVGLCLGVFAGAVIAELTVHGRTGQSVRVGVGATKGKLIGMALKLVFSLVVLAVSMIKGLPI